MVMVGAVSLLCWQTSQGARDKDDAMELYGLFVDAVEQVEKNYVRPVNRRELLDSALKGMLQDLDPHSAYINTSQWKQFRRQLEGSFGGIGISVEIDSESDRLKVIAPMVGTPAYRAGMLAGDLILDIDGQSTDGITIEKAIETLQGRPGTSVKLKVLHDGAKEPTPITLTRAIIEIPSVLGDHRKSDDSWDYILDKENKIAYVRLTSFIQHTTDEVAKVLDELKAQGAKGLVLDLRDNPGGLLSAAVEISDLFVDEGVIVSTKGRNTVDKVYRAKKDEKFPNIPMAVLVNGGSASASEILSACLQDDNRAVVVGSRSFGKGSVQNIIELEDGNSVLKLTVATYFRPSGKNIHKFKNAKDEDEWGVKPNPGLEVKLTPKEYIAWALGRRDRDLLSSANPPKVVEPKGDAPKDEPKDKDEAAKDKDKEKAETPRSKQPFVDKQLDKALEVVREKIKAAIASKG